MTDLKRTQLGVFLFLVPAQAAPGKANDADDDQNDADDSSRFHDVDVTVADGDAEGIGSILRG